MSVVDSRDGSTGGEVAAVPTDLPDGFQVQVDLRCAQRGDLRLCLKRMADGLRRCVRIFGQQ